MLSEVSKCIMAVLNRRCNSVANCVEIMGLIGDDAVSVKVLVEGPGFVSKSRCLRDFFGVDVTISLNLLWSMSGVHNGEVVLSMLQLLCLKYLYTWTEPSSLCSLCFATLRNASTENLGLSQPSKPSAHSSLSRTDASRPLIGPPAPALWGSSCTSERS